MLAEFRGFLTKTNALALAVGVIIGAAVGSVVSAMAADILMPIVGYFLPGGDWRAARIVLSTSTDAAGKVTESAILYGHFLGTLLDFVIISLVLFLIIRSLVKPVAAAAAEPMRKCPECLEMIPEAARRCRACASAVAAA
jgi:large conductance mechanosensitive channel